MFKETTAKIKERKDKLHFSYLPDFADFLLKNHLEEFSSFSLASSYEEDIPLLKFFSSLSDKELQALSLNSQKELLEKLSQNKVHDYIELSIRRWTENQVPLIKQGDIVSEDLISVSFVRRKTFRWFLSRYTLNVEKFAQVMEEVDRFISLQEELSFDILFQMNQQKMNEHLYFIEKINNTSPGINYVFDLKEKKEIYSNHKNKLSAVSESDIQEADINFHDGQLLPKDISRLNKHYDNFASAKDGEIRTIEYKVKGNKGRSTWFRRHEIVFKRTWDGIPTQVIGIALDISKEKETSLELEHRDQQLQEAQEIAGLGTFEWDLAGDQSSFSTQLLKTFELDGPSNLVSFMECVHPDDREKLKAAIAKSMTEHGHYECEYRYRKNEHEKVIWSRGVVTFLDGKPTKMQGFAMDVTKNRTMNEQLKENEKTFRQLIDNAPDAVIVIDENSNILLWNPKAEEIFGWSSAEILGKTLMDSIIPAKYKTAHFEGIKRLHTTGKSRVLNKTIEITAVNKKNEEFYIALSIAASKWNGKPVFISFIRDISKEKIAEIELEENRNKLTLKNAELERMNNELSSFSYVAGHDLKEPLRKIRTYSNFIIDKGNKTLPVEIQDYVNRIITSATNMQNLIDDLLAFSRTTSSEKNLMTVDLNQLLTEVTNSLKERIEEKNAKIISTRLPVIQAIPFQFQQLLENIIGNALKYSKPDVAPLINITSGLASGNDHIDQGGHSGMNYNKISISDNGIGFEQEYAEKIFELFQRLHGKDEYSGTGIGLAICKKIVENLDGFISAEGKEGSGSTFNIFIPIR